MSASVYWGFRGFDVVGVRDEGADAFTESVIILFIFISHQALIDGLFYDIKT